MTLAIEKSSFYAAFQSKEQLFREALELYRREVWLPALRELDERPTTRDAFEWMLRAFASGFRPPGRVHGCLIISGAANCAKPNLQLHADLRKLRRSLHERFEARLERGVREGDLPSQVDKRALASFCVTVHYGLALQAHDRAQGERLRESVRCAMAAWDAIVATAAS